MSEEARQGELEFRLALEWREEYHWMAPWPMKEFFDLVRQRALARGVPIEESLRIKVPRMDFKD